MKELKWDANAALFDRFGRFHINDDAFSMIQFETGEVVFTKPCPDPDLRTTYDKYGVQVFAQSDSCAPTLYTPDGVKVPAAWFGEGTTYMVHDFATSLVVPLHSPRQKRHERPEVPAWARGFACYWAGAGSPPVGGEGFILRPPYQLTKEEREYTREFTQGRDIIVKMERYGSPHPVGVLLSSPTLADVRKAMADGVPPLEFLRGYSSDVIAALSSSPIGGLERDRVYYKYLTTKGGK